MCEGKCDKKGGKACVPCAKAMAHAFKKVKKRREGGKPKPSKGGNPYG